MLEHRQTLVHQLADHALRQPCPRLELVDHDADDPEVGIVILTDLTDVVEQGVERAPGGC